MTSHLTRSNCPGLLLILASLPAVIAADQPIERQQLLIVVGAPGLPEFGDQFRTWADRWQHAIAGTDVECRIIGQDDVASDKPLFIKAVAQRASIASREPLWIVLIGHGTYDGRAARFNLRGPDVTASEIAELLAGSPRPIVLINCTSSSAPFINAISGANRTIVTATKGGGQVQFARFGDALSAAISGSEADLDKDGQVSLLEACVLATHRTDEFYQSEGRLATEHALLDDNGDGLGTRCADWNGVRLELDSKAEKPDGQMAKKLHLVRSKEERQLTVQQREIRDRLETRLEELRKQRYELPESEYLNQLESVLRPLAELYRETEQAADQSPANLEPN
jgi:hypothetical protein